MNKNNGRCRNFGFTLVEVIVVVGVLGILMGMLIPAVQRIRETANRVKCANNLQQIGLATFSYNDRHGALPPASLGQKEPTWAFLILPGLDQENLYKLWNYRATNIEGLDTTPLRIDMPVFYCPSRGRGNEEWKRLKIQYWSTTCGGTHPPIDSSILYGTPSDYAVSVGTGDTDEPFIQNGRLLLPDGSFASIPVLSSRDFFIHRGLKFSEFSDSLANTILLGEKHLPTTRIGEVPYDCSVWDGHFPPCNFRGAGPDHPLAISGTEVSWSFGSAHPGICQFVFCDWSVRAIKTTIDPVVLGLLANRHDGQVVPDY